MLIIHVTFSITSIKPMSMKSKFLSIVFKTITYFLTAIAGALTTYYGI